MMFRMSGSPRIFIPADIDEALERSSPPELRGSRKKAARVTAALRKYLASVAERAGNNEQVAPAGDRKSAARADSP